MLLPLALLALFPSRTALAASFPEPFELQSRLLLVSADKDLDGDGLSDEGEAELARRARPYYVFSSQENALEPGEPGTFFQARPEGCAGPRSRCAGKDLTVAIRYVNLWRRDGGYGRNSICRDRHTGDNQSLTVRVRSSDDGRTFRIVSVENWGFTWPTKSGAVEFRDGLHPEIWFSAGKHHQFFDGSYHGRPAPYTEWGCVETLDAGNVFPSVVRGNVGEPERHDGFIGDLTAFGFPGESAWSDKPFCGGLPCKPDNPTSSTAAAWNKAPFFVPR